MSKLAKVEVDESDHEYTVSELTKTSPIVRVHGHWIIALPLFLSLIAAPLGLTLTISLQPRSLVARSHHITIGPPCMSRSGRVCRW